MSLMNNVGIMIVHTYFARKLFDLTALAALA